MIGKLIDEALILEDLEATDKAAALPEILAAARTAGLFSARIQSGLLESLEEREAKGSTGIGNGVAVPHVKAKGLKEMWLVLARSVDGLEYRAIDGRPVHVVFLLGSPTDRAEDHLKVLRWVSSLARNADFRRFLMGASGVEEIRDLLREMSPAEPA